MEEEQLGYVKFSSLHIYIYNRAVMVFASRNYQSPPAATSTKMKRIQISREYLGIYSRD